MNCHPAINLAAGKLDNHAVIFLFNWNSWAVATKSNDFQIWKAHLLFTEIIVTCRALIVFKKILLRSEQKAPCQVFGSCLLLNLYIIFINSTQSKNWMHKGSVRTCSRNVQSVFTPPCWNGKLKLGKPFS